MNLFKRTALAAVLFMAACNPAAAQWQAPQHSVPVGQGVGVMGFGSAAPGAAGQVMTSNGTSADPSFQPPAPAGGYALMVPHVNQVVTGSAPWRVFDINGIDISSICAGTKSQCLLQFIQYTIANGQPARVVGNQSPVKTTQTGTATSGSKIITGLSNTALFNVGDFVAVRGANNTFIPSFTTVTSIDSPSQIHINNNAVGSGSLNMTFSNTVNAIAAEEAIVFPPFENWWFEADGINLTFSTAITTSGFLFDSVMASHFVWNALVVYQPSGGTNNALVEFHPVNPVPLDGIVTVTSSYIKFQSLAASPTATGVVRWNIDTGGIGGNTFDFIEVNGAQFGFVAQFACANCVFWQNIINAPNVHDNSVAGAIIGGVTTRQANYGYNIWNVAVSSTPSCYNTWGQKDLLNVTCTSATQGVIFNTGSSGNHYNLTTNNVTTPLVPGTGNQGFVN